MSEECEKFASEIFEEMFGCEPVHFMNDGTEFCWKANSWGQKEFFTVVVRRDDDPALTVARMAAAMRERQAWQDRQDRAHDNTAHGGGWTETFPAKPGCYWVAPTGGNHTLAPNQPYVVYVDEEGTVLVPGYESAYPRETFPPMVWQPVQPHTFLK